MVPRTVQDMVLNTPTIVPDIRRYIPIQRLLTTQYILSRHIGHKCQYNNQHSPFHLDKKRSEMVSVVGSFLVLDGASLVVQPAGPFDVSVVLQSGPVLVGVTEHTSLHIVHVLILSMLSSRYNNRHIGQQSVLSYNMVTYISRRPVVQDHHYRTVS